MIRVDEAIQIIQLSGFKLQLDDVEISAAVNRVLAESVLADRDFPPFDRVAMDGIAIQAERFLTEGQEFSIESIQAAGSPRTVLMDSNSCIEVMTGAVLPENTSAVIRYEDVSIQNGKAKILLKEVKHGLNIHKQGSDMRKDAILLTPGQMLSPAEIALLASVGKALVKVWKFPKAAVISSGDELVEISASPLPYQIRRSNVYALQAAMQVMGWSSNAFHLMDNQSEIKKSLQKIVHDHDVIILSGGVSKGKFDFIPESLEELGIEKRFHQVNQRPGKPFWFGTSSDHAKIVFALPGNPVSTFLCFYKYIRPWLLNCFGVKFSAQTAILASDLVFTPELTYFLQVHVKIENGKAIAYPKPGGGSGDFVNLNEVDGFLELPADQEFFKAGESYPFISFRV